MESGKQTTERGLKVYQNDRPDVVGHVMAFFGLDLRSWGSLGVEGRGARGKKEMRDQSNSRGGFVAIVREYRLSSEF